MHKKMKRVKPKHNGIFASNPCLSVICGKTGSGKTYLLFRSLLQPNLLDYNVIYIYTSTPNQPAYQFLKHGFEKGLSKEGIEYLFHTYENDDAIQSSVSSFCDEFRNDPKFRGNEKIEVHLSSKAIPMPENLDEKKKNLVIFDDVVNQKDQSLQREYFIRGRHMNCTVFYLTQRYYDVPKIVRDNSNLIILFKQPHRSLTLLFNELDAENADKFRLIAREAWNSRHGYVAINTALDDDENLTTEIFPNQEQEG